MADELFLTEFPDIQSFIKDLNLLDENVNKAVRTGLKKGANLILAEQKRLAPKQLSEYISTGSIYTTKKGVLGITSGYQKEVFKTDEHGQNPGIAGMVKEFGRPGQSPERSGDKDSIGRKKGVIQAEPHIRRGFDNVVDRAVQTVIDSINTEINKFGD